MTAIPTKKQIRAWAAEALEANGRPDMLPTIKWAWSDRMTHSLGRAYYQTREIRLSRGLFKTATVAEQRNTVIHEVCHLVAPGGHGKPWRLAMHRAGVAAQQYHSLKPTVDRTVAKVCGCGTGRWSKTRSNRARKGVEYWCGACKTPTEPDTAEGNRRRAMRLELQDLRAANVSLCYMRGKPARYGMATIAGRSVWMPKDSK